jgi:hypothetical protein
MQTSCSTVCLASSRCFANIPDGALWEEVPHYGDDNYRLALMSWIVYLRLTLGGMLSNDGVSEQPHLFFKHSQFELGVASMNSVGWQVFVRGRC